MLQLPPFRYQTNNAALYAGAALASVVITSATTFNVAENTTAVATLTATGGGTITWSLTGGADLAKFTVNTSSGALTFNSAPDFETPTDADGNNIYLVQVQATNGVTSDTNSLSVTVTDVAETVLDLNFTTMAPTLDPRITFTRTSLATYYGSDGLLKYAGNNWVWPSADFSTGWTALASGTVTVDNILSPDGTMTADRLNHVTAGTVSGGGVTRSLNAGRIFSVYAKAGTKTFLMIQNGTSTTANQFCWFDLSTGVVGTRGSIFWSASGIQSVGSGWYRCWAKVVSGTSTFLNIVSMRVGETNGSTNCTSPGDIYIWGAQGEGDLGPDDLWLATATGPSTYLPTTTAAYHAPRFDYDPVTHAAKGLLIEEARTNVVLQNRDLTNASWVKTNCTAAKNQTGIDGVANSASSLTASAANATCLQAITLGASQRFQSAYIKRLTGSGVVNMTMDGGTTWTAITVTSSWTRVSVPAAFLGSPNVGFRLVTSGDAIAVDYVQNENGSLATSAIATTTAAVTRAADVATMTGTNFSSWYNQTAGTLIAEFDVLGTAGTRTVFQIDDNTTNERIFMLASNANDAVARCTLIDNGVNQATLASTASVVPLTPAKAGFSFAVNDFAFCYNGETVKLDTSGTLPTVTQLRFGVSNLASESLDGHLRRIQFWNTAKSDAELQALTV